MHTTQGLWEIQAESGGKKNRRELPEVGKGAGCPRDARAPTPVPDSPSSERGRSCQRPPGATCPLQRAHTHTVQALARE